MSVHVCCASEVSKLREVLLYNRLWRAVPLPLAKDMFAALWHAKMLTMYPGAPIAAVKAPGVLVDVSLLDHKAAIVFKVNVAE